MGDYKKLLEYIPYFENENIEFCKWDAGYPQYNVKLKEFIESVYKTDLLRTDYLDYLDEKIKDHNLSAAIPTADLEFIRAILTSYVRQERFCSGAWAAAAKDKVFLKILYRLKDLHKGEDGLSAD